MEPLPDRIRSETELDELLARPSERLVDAVRRLDGDITVLGAGGKIGPSLVRLAVNAQRAAGRDRRVVAVSRFPNSRVRTDLETAGAECVACDLLDPAAVDALPRTPHVLFLAGRKFGTPGAESATWAANTVVPVHCARAFAESRIVVYSTGCVYPLVTTRGQGSRETDPPDPVGEYAASCVGRERIFEDASRRHGTRMLLFRLNYAIDLRYGVLVDIARTIAAEEPVDLSVCRVNVIWQGDANERAILCLEHAQSPPAVLNVTGPDIVDVRTATLELGARLKRPVRFTGHDKGLAWLSNARRSVEWFGPPAVSTAVLLRWVAAWIEADGPVLDKPTMFEVTDGRFAAASAGRTP